MEYLDFYIEATLFISLLISIYEVFKWKKIALQEHNEKLNIIHNNERIATQFVQEKETRKKEQEAFSRRIQELIRENNAFIETIKQLSKRGGELNEKYKRVRERSKRRRN